MSKNKTGTQPPKSQPAESTVETSTPATSAPEPLENESEEELDGLRITIPTLQPLEGGYAQEHVEAVLKGQEPRTLRLLQHTLEMDAAQLDDGTYVRRPAHVIRWLLQRIGDAA